MQNLPLHIFSNTCGKWDRLRCRRAALAQIILTANIDQCLSDQSWQTNDFWSLTNCFLKKNTTDNIDTSDPSDRILKPFRCSFSELQFECWPEFVAQSTRDQVSNHTNVVQACCFFATKFQLECPHLKCSNVCICNNVNLRLTRDILGHLSVERKPLTSPLTFGCEEIKTRSQKKKTFVSPI